MPDTKISALSPGSSIENSDELLVARSGTNVKVLGTHIIRPFLNTSITNSESPYTAIAGYLIEVDTTNDNVSITLPSVSSNLGQMIVIKKKDNSSNTVTVAGTASDTIDGSSTHVLNTHMEALILVAASEWVII